MFTIALNQAIAKFVEDPTVPGLDVELPSSLNGLLHLLLEGLGLLQLLGLVAHVAAGGLGLVHLVFYSNDSTCFIFSDPSPALLSGHLASFFPSTMSCTRCAQWARCNFSRATKMCTTPSPTRRCAQALTSSWRLRRIGLAARPPSSSQPRWR